jgi:hypothetical protein
LKAYQPPEVRRDWLEGEVNPAGIPQYLFVLSGVTHYEAKYLFRRAALHKGQGYHSESFLLFCGEHGGLLICSRRSWGVSIAASVCTFSGGTRYRQKERCEVGDPNKRDGYEEVLEEKVVKAGSAVAGVATAFTLILFSEGFT